MDKVVGAAELESQLLGLHLLVSPPPNPIYLVVVGVYICVFIHFQIFNFCGGGLVVGKAGKGKGGE